MDDYGEKLSNRVYDGNWSANPKVTNNVDDRGAKDSFEQV